MNGGLAATGDDELAENLIATLRELLKAARHHDSTRNEGGELTTAQMQLMSALIDNGPLRISELAQRTCVVMPTMSISLRRLERRAYIARSECAEDRRVSIVWATRRGRTAHGLALASSRAELERRIELLSDADRSALDDALPVLTKWLVLADERSPADDSPRAIAADSACS